MIAVLIALAQAGTPAPVPASFSILAPVPELPCGARPADGEVVVCGRKGEPALSPRLPLPDERGVPDHAVPGNPDLRATEAFKGTPCIATQGGCPVGFGNADLLLKLGAAAVHAIERAVAKPVDRAGRVAIPIDDPTPGHAQP